MRRTVVSRGTKSLKRTSFKKKPKSKEQIAEDKAETEEMWNLFNLLWDNLREKKCWNCNIPIYGENLTIYWDHLLEKSKYPELKLERDNLFFCCWPCHSQKGNGFPGEIHKQAIDKAKEKYL